MDKPLEWFVALLHFRKESVPGDATLSVHIDYCVNTDRFVQVNQYIMWKSLIHSFGFMFEFPNFANIFYPVLSLYKQVL